MLTSPGIGSLGFQKTEVALGEQPAEVWLLYFQRGLEHYIECFYLAQLQCATSAFLMYTLRGN